MKKTIMLALAALSVSLGAFGLKAFADSKSQNACCVESAACCPSSACCK